MVIYHLPVSKTEKFSRAGPISAVCSIMGMSGSLDDLSPKGSGCLGPAALLATQDRSVCATFGSSSLG